MQIQQAVSRIFGTGTSLGLKGGLRWLLVVLVAGVSLSGMPGRGQTAGEGAIEGTVTDVTGAAIPNATVTATNNATRVKTTRTASGSGVFTLTPLIPGTYTLRVEAAGFQALEQGDLVVNALNTLGFNPKLTVGAQTETVTVTEAPPALDTTSAMLGTVMENETYKALPLQMNNAQRDPTAFAALTPGAQSGTRAPIIGGTGNFLAEVYLDGLPVTTINQQGDNRLVSQGLSVDAVEQFQVVTSSPSAEYQGAGIINFTMKSGTLKYHGQVSDFVRNTIFDTWCYTCKAATVKNSTGQTVQAPKPVEHQNEFSASGGGPIPLTRGKGFFFVAYDRFHGRRGAIPVLNTIATPLMRTGDFSELGKTALIFDPTSTTCNAAGTCTRKPFMGLKNGVPTPNVIPASYLSPIAQYMQKFLPAPSNGNVENNYLGGIGTGFDNHLLDVRIDYDITSKQRISGVLARGTVVYNPINLGSHAVELPLPYTIADYATITPDVYDIEHSYAITANTTNQFKFGFTRFAQIIKDSTQGVANWTAGAAGITGLPPGQASEELPGASFSASQLFGTVQSQWTGNGASIATQTTVPNAFTLVDNLQTTKGKHSLTFGISMQWLEDNVAAQAGPSGILTMNYNANSTAQFSGNTLSSKTSGYSYASYLLGAVGGAPAILLQPFSEEGGRYHPVSPYFQDDWKVTPKLTMNIGLRWDYFPPYHEVLDRMSFLNPTEVNPATGNMGALEFTGKYGGSAVSCGCRTPVHTYWKNFGPRLGFAYQVNEKTVFRGGFGEVFSMAGGVGGRGGAGNGTGQLGFDINAQASPEVTQGPGAGPSFYLNNGAYFSSIGKANTNFGGPSFTLPANPGPGPGSAVLSTGNYVNASGAFVAPSGITYADPSISGRAPEFNFYNFGFERSLTNNLTIGVNYVGSESHFVGTGANARGYWANQLNPAYLAALGGVSDASGTVSVLRAAATPANVAKAAAALPGLKLPYAGFGAAAAKSSSATIAQMLTAFPQYSGVNDVWGQNVGNFSYNSLQITLDQRPWKGLSYTVNYTYSKNIGDDGTFRSGFDIPAAAISGGGQSWKQDRIERSWTTISTPQSLHAFGVYSLPFGRGKLGGESLLVRTLAGGWQISGIYSYGSGTPLAVKWNGCTAPGQGQCMPDLNTSFSGYAGKNARTNGSWGKGVTAATLGSVQYIDVNAFATPNNAFSSSSQPLYLIGNAPRTKPLNLSNPSSQDLDASIHRAFDLPGKTNLMFELDCLNVTNKVTFEGINTSWAAGSKTFGTIGGANGNSRDFQLAAHFNF